MIQTDTAWFLGCWRSYFTSIDGTCACVKTRRKDTARRLTPFWWTARERYTNPYGDGVAMRCGQAAVDGTHLFAPAMLRR